MIIIRVHFLYYPFNLRGAKYDLPLKFGINFAMTWTIGQTITDKFRLC